MNQKTIIKMSLFIFLFISLCASKAEALDYPVIHAVQSLSGQSPSLKLNYENIYPGIEINKIFFLQNDCNFQNKIENISLNGFKLKDIKGSILDDSSQSYKNFTKWVYIKLVYESDVLYNGSIEQILRGNNIINDNNKFIFMPGTLRKMILTVGMDEDADNTIEDLSADFDIIIYLKQVVFNSETKPSNSNDRENEIGYKKDQDTKPEDKPEPQLEGDEKPRSDSDNNPQNGDGFLLSILPATNGYMDGKIKIYTGFLFVIAGMLIILSDKKDYF